MPRRFSSEIGLHPSVGMRPIHIIKINDTNELNGVSISSDFDDRHAGSVITRIKHIPVMPRRRFPGIHRCGHDVVRVKDAAPDAYLINRVNCFDRHIIYRIIPRLVVSVSSILIDPC